MIEFRLETRSGIAPYLQIVQQVKHALRLGMLRAGDQLPTVKEVVGSIAINPNTVLKAYRELEHEGLVQGRPGVGTFVLKGPSTARARCPPSQPPSLDPQRTRSRARSRQRRGAVRLNLSRSR